MLSHRQTLHCTLSIPPQSPLGGLVRIACTLSLTAFCLGQGLACAAEAEHADAGAKQPPAVWTYSGAHGPLHWSTIKGDFVECGAGHHQSPIALKSATADSHQAPDFQINYSPVTVKLINNSHSIQANVSDASATVTFQDRVYHLVQFHLHAPSEHTIDGKRYPVEFHFVNSDAEGHITVIAVMVHRGKSNPDMTSFLSAMPTQPTMSDSDAAAHTVSVDLTHILPKNHRAAYLYSGSLTTPPCTENVNWIVLDQPIEMSGSQIAAFTRLFHDNRRPLQLINHREIYRSQ